MSQCPGCGISYCLNCNESVDPDIFRCEDCQKEHLANDPFVKTAQEAGKEIHELKGKARAVHESLSELQKVVHGITDQESRDAAFHAVIDIRTFVKDMMLKETM